VSLTYTANLYAAQPLLQSGINFVYFRHMNEYFSIGKIVATYGIQGEVVLKHSLGKKTSLKGLQALFLEMQKDRTLPYFIQHTKIKSDTELYVKLEGADTKEQAHLLTQKNVWLPQNDFEKYAAKSAPISLIGFTMFNEGELIGVVDEVIEQPLQVLCKVMYKNKEALIPLHAETLGKVDNKKKEVHVHLPEGLLEIFL
jgi:16S rRNA processing protein RimM